MSEIPRDDALGRIDALCDAFEAAWGSHLAGDDPRPELEAYLRKADAAEQQKLFEELLCPLLLPFHLH